MIKYPEVVNENPPNIEEIAKHFPIGRHVVYAYGNKIFNPNHLVLRPSILLHEQVHLNQQGDNPEGWWHRYIEEPQFRLDQEFEAHLAEYRAMLYHATSNRHEQRAALKVVARKLASPLYGKLISVQKAARALKAGEL